MKNDVVFVPKAREYANDEKYKRVLGWVEFLTDMTRLREVKTSEATTTSVCKDGIWTRTAPIEEIEKTVNNDFLTENLRFFAIKYNWKTALINEK